jgi:hypothetical protein
MTLPGCLGRSNVSMDHQKIKTMNEVRASFAAWKELNDQIASLQAALVRNDADRDPARLHADLAALQLESDRLLVLAQQALLRIKTPRSSNGDSTWG